MNLYNLPVAITEQEDIGKQLEYAIEKKTRIKMKIFVKKCSCLKLYHLALIYKAWVIFKCTIVL